MFSIVPFHVKLPTQVLTDNSGVHFLPDLTLPVHSTNIYQNITSSYDNTTPE